MPKDKPDLMGKLIPILLIMALAGLIFIQYRYLIIGLRLEKTSFDRQIEAALQKISTELEEDYQLSILLASTFQEDQGYFDVSTDTLLEASTSILKDYLTDRLQRSGLHIDFSFAAYDQDTSSVAIQSDDFSFDNYPNGFYTMNPGGILQDSCTCNPKVTIKMNHLVNYLIRQLNGITIPSTLLILVIILCFLWYIQITNRHRKLDQIKNDFINNLTHELKTPVFSIGLAAGMLEHKVNEEQRALTRLILTENARLTEHIEKVLDLASLDHPKGIFNPMPIHIHQLLKPIIDLTTLRLQQVEGQILLELQATKDTVIADSNHLQNAISNIVENAIKYGGQTPLVRICTFSDETHIHISITDNGKGIPKSEQSQIFRKYYRIQSGDLHPVKGFGLGLSYAQQVAKKLRGAIRVESEEGVGTQFIITLPIQPKT